MGRFSGPNYPVTSTGTEVVSVKSGEAVDLSQTAPVVLSHAQQVPCPPAPKAKDNTAARILYQGLYQACAQSQALFGCQVITSAEEYYAAVDKAVDYFAKQVLEKSR